MSDETTGTTSTPPARETGWSVTLDRADMALIAGIGLIGAGGAALHWALPVIAIGGALVVWAIRSGR